jgi:phage terminase small subunit
MQSQKKSVTDLPTIPGQPKAPRRLRKDGRRLWNSVNNAFALEEHDLILLNALASALDRRNQAERDLREHKSLTFKNRHGELKPHPCIAVIRDLDVTIARLRRELNLSEAEQESRPPKLKFGGRK